MKKQLMKMKADRICWKQFSRHGDAIFRSLGREIRIGVLSVATLALATPDSASAMMAMSQQKHGEDDALASLASSEEDDALDLSALQHGDLLFNVTSPTRDGLAQAIVNVTEGFEDLQVSHVAIVCKRRGRIYALEASGENGVWLNPIESYFAKADRSAEGKPLVLLGRLHDVSGVKASVRNALKQLGKPYDDLYLPGDSAVYCSELVQMAYVDGKGNEVFPLIPMSFHDKSGNVTDFWKEHYAKRGMQVPEGWPGSNPGGISRSEKVVIVKRFF